MCELMKYSTWLLFPGHHQSNPWGSNHVCVNSKSGSGTGNRFLGPTLTITGQFHNPRLSHPHCLGWVNHDLPITNLSVGGCDKCLPPGLPMDGITGHLKETP